MEIIKVESSFEAYGGGAEEEKSQNLLNETHATTPMHLASIKESIEKIQALGKEIKKCEIAIFRVASLIKKNLLI